MAYIQYPFEKTTSVPLADEFIIAGNGNILLDLVVGI